MKRLGFVSLVVLVLGFSTLAHADLTVIGTGYMVGDPTQTQYQLIYDPAQNLTWYDYSNTSPGIPSSGPNQPNALSWAQNLGVVVNGVTITGWTLPTTPATVIPNTGGDRQLALRTKGNWGPSSMNSAIVIPVDLTQDC